MSRAHVIRPAGAGHETLYVLLASLLIVALAAGVVWLRGEREDEQAIAAHQIDARRDLTAAEQGLYTDLRVAFGYRPWPMKACHHSWSTPAARAGAVTSGPGWCPAPTWAAARHPKLPAACC